jgi:hypothetical protein
LFDKKRCGSNKTFLLIMRQFICAPNVRSVKRVTAEQEKNPRVQIWIIICATNFVCIAIGAENFDAPLLNCMFRIPQCQSNPLFILLERAEKEI